MGNLRIDILSIQVNISLKWMPIQANITLEWMPERLADKKLIFFQTTSRYLNQLLTKIFASLWLH